ncbi:MULTISPECIES: Tat proofreading chaperone DmsD [unclassified Adlercreutzia]|uniref:Tat proofreading chaperone DmsD n=1 Tax=unclassified Adlercreutzia TaxID=2636013 RepID=UPI0013EDF6D0|nr:MULTISPECIES: Tat proofreading chaperone DmsD [unclassified Adlercreutzia]
MNDLSDAAREAALDHVLEQVAFVGETLGPLFLNDPGRGGEATRAALASFAALDARAAAAEWPFVDEEEARASLELMRAGAAAGVDDALVWEYRRLFVGPAKKAAPPWGSVYTDRECVVFGASTLELRAWMRAHGIERLGDKAEPEDHIGLMLLLMTWIADNRPELLDEYLREHLLTWAGHFLSLVEREAGHPFYEGLARLARASLEGVRVSRGLEVIYPRFYR